MADAEFRLGELAYVLEEARADMAEVLDRSVADAAEAGTDSHLVGPAVPLPLDITVRLPGDRYVRVALLEADEAAFERGPVEPLDPS